MRFERIAWDLDARFYRCDSAVDNQSDRNAPQPHADHLSHPDGRVGNARTKPNTEKIEKNDRENESKNREHRDADEIERIHKYCEPSGVSRTRKSKR